MYVGGVLLLRNFPFVGEVRLTVLTRFGERAIRSYRTIDRVGPSKRDFTSQSEIRHKWDQQALGRRKSRTVVLDPHVLERELHFRSKFPLSHQLNRDPG
jgi:hypothetical protein